MSPRNLDGGVAWIEYYPLDEQLESLIKEALKGILAADSEDEAETEPILQRVTLKQDLAEEFVDDATSLVDDVGEDPVLLEYDPGYKPAEHELCYIRVSDMKPVEDIIKEVSRVDYAGLFEEDDEFITRLRFYAVVVEGKSEKAVFFHSYSPKKELTRSHWMLLRSYEGVYDRVKRNIFAMDEEGEVDCFCFGDYLFIRDVRQFERIFRYLEALTEKGEATIASVASHIPISNLKEFKEVTLGDRRMLAKLVQISGKPYLKTLTMEQLKEVNRKFKLGVRIVEENGVEKLVFEGSREKRWKILNLLDDAYLESPMTELKYEANSKHAI